MTCVIRMMMPTILGLRVPSAARIVVEERMIAMSIIVNCLVTHKMSSQLIVLSPQTL
jgi:hypothetical protein